MRDERHDNASHRKVYDSINYIGVALRVIKVEKTKHDRRANMF